MTQCCATWRDKQCLWESDRPHVEHRIYVREGDALLLCYFTDDGASFSRRIMRILTLDGSVTYVDPVGLNN